MLGRKLGYLSIGSKNLPYPMYSMNIWNSLDDLALYKSLERREDEDNITFRARIIKAGPYNCSIQGLTNYLTDSFDLNKFYNKEKTIFFSTFKPLSYLEYIKLNDITEEYIGPEVIADGISYKLPYEPITLNEFYKAEINDNIKVTYTYVQKTSEDITWTLWKNLDQTFSNMFQCSKAPVNSVKLRYQYLNEYNQLEYIEESNFQYTYKNDKIEYIQDSEKVYE